MDRSIFFAVIFAAGCGSLQKSATLLGDGGDGGQGAPDLRTLVCPAPKLEKCPRNAMGRPTIDHCVDPLHCGACFNVCPDVANGQPGCRDGACAVQTCNPGFTDCDRQPGNGCEALGGCPDLALPDLAALPADGGPGGG